MDSISIQPSAHTKTKATKWQVIPTPSAQKKIRHRFQKKLIAIIFAGLTLLLTLYQIWALGTI